MTWICSLYYKTKHLHCLLTGWSAAKGLQAPLESCWTLLCCIVLTVQHSSAAQQKLEDATAPITRQHNAVSRSDYKVKLRMTGGISNWNTYCSNFPTSRERYFTTHYLFIVSQNRRKAAFGLPFGPLTKNSRQLGILSWNIWKYFHVWTGNRERQE